MSLIYHEEYIDRNFCHFVKTQKGVRSKFLDKQVHFEYYTVIFGNNKKKRLFSTGVLNSSFGKIFGKFRKSFGHSKTGVLYWTIFDRQNFSAFDFRHLPKVENFWQTHGLNVDTLKNFFNVCINA